eukprot:11225650-Lingulodinium_polyedra.AAC.1
MAGGDCGCDGGDGGDGGYGRDGHGGRWRGRQGKGREFAVDGGIPPTKPETKLGTNVATISLHKLVLLIVIQFGMGVCP